MNDTITPLIAAGVLVGVVTIFILITIKLRRDGGSMTTIALGATDAFLNKDRSKAAETIVNENAGKKFEAQESGKGDPLDAAPGEARSPNNRTDVFSPRS